MPTQLEPGSSAAALRTPLEDWNAASDAEAETALLACCGSPRWAEHLVARRPFADPAALHHAATNLWFLLDESDWLAAFASHPRIGERKAPVASEGFLSHSAEEQAEAQQSLAEVADALADGNRAYEKRFGFLYIVFASGRSARELLDVLEDRLLRDRITELHEAARQQHRITTLRMQKWLKG